MAGPAAHKGLKRLVKNAQQLMKVFFFWVTE
jgi:hypothetical protein